MKRGNEENEVNEGKKKRVTIINASINYCQSVIEINSPGRRQRKVLQAVNPK